MSDEAIIDAEYVEWKMVKTRSTLQLIFEVPLEKQALVMTALGVPLPNVSNPVAICRLRVPAAVAQLEDHRPPTKLAQLAGIICNEGGFWHFLEEKGDYKVTSADEAAAYVRLICGVKSRSELDTNIIAAQSFRTLKADYDLWLKDVAA